MMTLPQSAARTTFLGMFLTILALSSLTAPAAFAQALPAAEAAPISTGFSMPTTLGTLQYAVSASQSLTWGYYGSSGSYAGTNLSGDLAYLSSSKQHPFSLVLSGGRSFSESGQASYSFVNLGFSQVANVGRWNFVISDNVSYLPGTPTAGLSGITGLGDLGVNPIQVGGDTGQGVLTTFADRVSNVVSASLSRQLTGRTSLTGSGSYSTMHFLDNSATSGTTSSGGLDNSAETGSVGLNHQIDARNTVGGTYAYSNFTYPGNGFGVPTPDFVSQTASASYSRKFTRKFSVNVSAGPQWTTVSGNGSATAISVFADASAAYAGKSASASADFTRSTNGGFGSVGGGVANSITARVSRPFAVVWSVAATANFSQTSSLPLANVAPYSFKTYVEGLQVSRAIVRSLSAYASYNLADQSVSSVPAVALFSGLSQSVSFGITYSPSSMHLGHQ
jgi:hypothetical protein